MGEYLENIDDKERVSYLFNNLLNLNIEQIIIIIKSIENQYIRINTVLKLFKYILYINFLYVVKNLDDSDKIGVISKMAINYQIDIIKLIESDKIKENYLEKDEYRKYYFDIITTLKDRNYIIKYFEKCNIMKNQIDLINSIIDEELKLFLIKCIHDNNYKLFALSNFDMYRNEYLEDMSKKILFLDDIDSKISFGVELEVNHKNIDYFSNIGNFFKDFVIKEEGSINDGMEIVSPILHYCKDDVILLASVCNILSKCGFYTNKYCGGHIHIGIDYFKEVNEILMFLYIYTNCEDIIYLILNRSGVKTRKNIYLYADKIRKNIELAINMGDFNNLNSISELLKVFKNIFPNRYYGINIMKNHPTIEFRVPNGEIDYYELMANIRFILRLVQKSREFSSLSEDYEIKIMLDRLKEAINLEEKLEILLDLLFDKEEEKDIYRERYYNNASSVVRFIMNINNCYFDKGVDFNKKGKIRKR